MNWRSASCVLWIAYNTNILKLESKFLEKPEAKTFEIFKGFKDSYGKIRRKRILGQARIFEGAKTYHVFIKTLLGSKFYLLPENRNPQKYEYVILTREPSQTPDKKYYWSSVGEGKILMGENQGLMKLEWDFFGSSDIYMRLEPVSDKIDQEMGRKEGGLNE